MDFVGDFSVAFAFFLLRGVRGLGLDKEAGDTGPEFMPTSILSSLSGTPLILGSVQSTSSGRTNSETV